MDECALLRSWLGQALDKEAVRELASRVVIERVHQHFDGQRLDEEVATLQEAPLWLQGMLSDAQWRALLYELLVAHPRCALLQAVVRALSESEHASEVQSNAQLCAVVGGTSSMQTFVATFCAQLSALRQGHAGAQATLNGMACAGEVEFFTAQLLMRTDVLADHPSTRLIEQAGGAMAEAATAMHGSSARRLQLLAAGVPRHSSFMSALVSILAADVISSGDAQTLRDQVERGVDVGTLRQPAILRLLLRALFDPSRPPKAEPRENLLRVLAALHSQVQGGAGGPGAGGPGAGEPGAAAAAGGPPSERSDAVLAALREAQRICEHNEVSEVTSSVALLQRCVQVPIVACGVLLWAREVLTNPQYSGARFNVSFLPPVVKLATSIAHQHPALQGEVCSLIHACLVHEPPADSDANALTTVSLRRLLLEGLLLLLARGCVIPVLDKLVAWLGDAVRSSARPDARVRARACLTFLLTPLMPCRH